MGYYTRYNLTWDDEGLDLSDIIHNIMGLSEFPLVLGPYVITENLVFTQNSLGYYAIHGGNSQCGLGNRFDMLRLADRIYKALSTSSDPNYSGNYSYWTSVLTGDDSYKWYEWKGDIERISRRFPNVLFTLKRDGEDSGDMSVEYFLNEKHESRPIEMTFQPTTLR